MAVQHFPTILSIDYPTHKDSPKTLEIVDLLPPSIMVWITKVLIVCAYSICGVSEVILKITRCYKECFY
jgi:hypothetical protein